VFLFVYISCVHCYAALE